MELNPATSLVESGGWYEVSVDDLKAGTDNALATGPFGSSIGSRFFERHGVPVIRGGNLSADGRTQLIDDGFVFVCEAKATELRRAIVRRGDLIFTCWGTINQVGLIGERAAYPRYLISNKQMKFTPDAQKADSLFLFYLFSGPELQRTILSQSIGSSVPGFNLGQLRALRFGVPPLPEQRAIAAALRDVDALLTALTQLIAKKRDLKQAAMQQLLTGQRRLPGFTGEWEVRRLGDIGSFSKGRGLPKENLSPLGTVPAVPYTAIYTDHDEILQLSRIVCFAKPADCPVVISSPCLLIASSSNMLENIGKATAFRGGATIAVGGDILVYKTSADVCFLSYLLSTRLHRKQIVFLSQGSTIRHVYATTFLSYEVALPTPAEQTAIAATLSDMDAELTALEARLTKTRALKQGMMQELLTGRTRLV